MQLLKPGQFEAVRPLFEPLRYNLVVDSILDGHTIGRIYADDSTHPTVALIWNETDALLVGGDPKQLLVLAALNRLIMTDLIPAAQQRGIPCFNLHHTDEWQLAIACCLTRRDCQTIATSLIPASIPCQVTGANGYRSGYELVPIDTALLRHVIRPNWEQLAEWIRSFWRGSDDFNRNGLGYCILDGDRIASWCFTVYVSGKRAELAVATVPEYRQQGLASVVAAACVDACLQQQRIPEWHCNIGNRASVCIAKKVGFQTALDYTVAHFDFPQ